MKNRNLFVATLVSAVFTFSAHAQQPVSISPKVLKLVQDIVLDDFITAALGGNSETEKSRALFNLNIAASVESKKLAEDYAANEVAADQKYKVKKSYIMVTGVVSSINKDYKGDPYVSLRGHAQFQEVQARFSDADAALLASLKKGQKVTFVCEVSGRIVSQVMLRSCTSPDSHAQIVRAPIDKYVAEVFSGKRKTDTKQGADMLTMTWMLGKKLPEDSPCFKSIADTKCEQQTTAILKTMTKEEKSAINDITKQLSPQ